MSSSVRILPVAFATLFLVAHLFALPRTLEDLDSVNFAMGVESFDVPAHQPHPPGYPVYILLGKISTGVLRVVAPALSRDHRAALGLAIWGVIAGTIAVFVFAAFWRAVGLDPVTAFLAAAVAIATPLFWFTAARPLSDVPGLVCAVAVQIMLIRALSATDASPPPRVWLIAAFAAGLLIGFRTQTMWLTGPLLIALAWQQLRRASVRGALMLTGAAAAGALVWAVPLLADSGIQRYLQSLTHVGANDFEAIELLATSPSWRLFRLAVRTTFTVLWSTRGLAQVVTALAIVGIVWLARRQRRTLGLVALAYAPYLVFHLLFQEPPNVRYTIPLAIPIGGLAIVALGALHRWAAIAGGLAIVAASLVTVHPALMIYAREGAPIFIAFQQMQRELPALPEPPQVQMHHQVWWGVRRAMEWYRPVWDTRAHQFPGDREWLDVIDYWRRGETRPVWFLGDLSRTDQKLFDPRSTRLAGRYELDDRVQMLMGDTRFDELSWTVLTRPRWMLGAGWALTPETAGVAQSDRAFPHQQPAQAFLLRDATPLRILIGGRYLSGSGPARISVELDDSAAAEWTVGAEPNWFARWIELPAGVPEGPPPYALMRVRVTPANASSGEVVVGLEQFDAAPATETMWAFGDGWHEPEGNPRTGRLWRWTSDASTVLITGPQSDLRLTISGESPLRSYDGPVDVAVRAGDQEIARFTISDDFTHTVVLPASSLGSGRVTIVPSRTFVQGDRDGGPDRRRLGLRIYSVAITR